MRHCRDWDCAVARQSSEPAELRRLPGAARAPPSCVGSPELPRPPRPAQWLLHRGGRVHTNAVMVSGVHRSLCPVDGGGSFDRAAPGSIIRSVGRPFGRAVGFGRWVYNWICNCICSPSTGNQLYRPRTALQAISYTESPSTSNQLYTQPRHRQPVIQSAVAQATSYTGVQSIGNQLYTQAKHCQPVI